MPSWQVYIRHSARKSESAGLCVHGDRVKATGMAAFILDVPADQILLEEA